MLCCAVPKAPEIYAIKIEYEKQMVSTRWKSSRFFGGAGSSRGAGCGENGLCLLRSKITTRSAFPSASAAITTAIAALTAAALIATALTATALTGVRDYWRVLFPKRQRGVCRCRLHCLGSAVLPRLLVLGLHLLGPRLQRRREPSPLDRGQERTEHHGYERPRWRRRVRVRSLHRLKHDLLSSTWHVHLAGGLQR